MQRACFVLLSMVALVATMPGSLAADATTSGAAAPPVLPTSLLSVPLTKLASNSPYVALQEAWDSNFSIRNTCADLLDEGRYAPARKTWVGYYASSIGQQLANLQTAISGSQYTDTLGASVSAMQNAYAQLQTAANALRSPTDDKYPTAFWGPTRDILTNATKLDSAIVAVLAGLEASTTPQPASGKIQAGVVARSADLDNLLKASKKIGDNITHLSAELDRLNLGWGAPPKQPLEDEFYQGAFTKQEILSQYKYMPSFVFTTDPEVARFTYRMPPRKNVLATYINDIGQLLNLMDTDMQAVQAAISASNDQALAAPWKAMETSYRDARQQYMALYNLVNNTTDDKLAADMRGDQTTYGKPIIALRDDMTQLSDAITDFVAITK